MGVAVNRAAEELSGSIEQLTSAAVEQSSSSAELLRVAEMMKNVARMVNQSTEEQSRVSREIDERIREMEHTAGEVNSAAELQLEATRAVTEAIEVLKEGSVRNGRMASQLTEVIANLAERSEYLRNETNKFTI
jgi:methyl-accepting chemotaxis protein